MLPLDLRPTIHVRDQLDVTLGDMLLDMRMLEVETGMSGLELRLLDAVGHADGGMNDVFDDEQHVALGTAIAVHTGRAEAPQEIFRGVVTAMEYVRDGRDPPSLVLHAEDALQKARMTRRTRVHEAATIAGVAAEVAKTANLVAEVTGLSEPLGTLVQLDESDLAFLRRLLMRHGAAMQVVGTALQVAPWAAVARGSVELHYGDQLLEVRVVADLADQTTGVTVSGWNASSGEHVGGHSDGVGLGPGEGRTGASILQAFTDRPEHLGQLTAVATQAEADAVANAAFARRARGFVRAHGLAVGDPALRIGTHVVLGGLPRRWNNTYYITRAEHCFDRRSGYFTRFTAECAYLGEA